MRRALPVAWSALLTAVMLWQALGPGYVLSYDMVWVPDLAMRPDFLGLGSALPRAVPSDAVVAALDEVVPGMLLQKVVLVGALMGAGLGAARLAPPHSLTGQLAAISLYQWNPFVIERLLIGHWPVLLGYAVLPWLVVASRRARKHQRFPPVLCLLLPVASLSASAGLMAALVILLLGWGPRLRTNLALVATVVAANAPWLVAGAVHVEAATTDPLGAEVFGLHGTRWLPAPVAALGLGGSWNSDVVPASRGGALGLIALLGVLVLCAFGVRHWWRNTDRRETLGLLICWVVGWGIAVLTWACPGAMGSLYEHVPGAGLLRDGSRMLALCAPLLVATASHGVGELRARVGAAEAPGVAATVALVLFPVAVLPDAAWGGSGALHAVDYPDSYAAAADVVEDVRARGGDGDVVVLPFTSYRAPEWNERRKVLDPLGRYLDPDFVVSGDLAVDGRTVAGEDPRAVRVGVALARRTPQARAEALADLGIGFVVLDKDEVLPGLPAELAPEVAGRRTEAGRVTVIALTDPAPAATSPGTRAAVTVGWLLYLALLAGAAGSVVRNLARRRGSGVS
ncbi:hypothetical protein [Nocardioides jensenii]|uniref:hypothetical protein n=1 Tax=Nocardioides jensenii TaxID=1843 RepID=UPI00082DA0F2|nr:hypothetical protein [Nocardioides jensenii]